MKIRAVGRHLLVKMDTEAIDSSEKKQLIALPQEVLDKEKGGVQIATILSVGESAFDDEPPSVRETIVAGRQVATARYPGVTLPRGSIRTTDKQLNEYRMISCDEVMALVALDGEEGADV